MKARESITSEVKAHGDGLVTRDPPHDTLDKAMLDMITTMVGCRRKAAVGGSKGQTRKSPGKQKARDHRHKVQADTDAGPSLRTQGFETKSLGQRLQYQNVKAKGDEDAGPHPDWRCRPSREEDQNETALGAGARAACFRAGCGRLRWGEA